MKARIEILSDDLGRDWVAQWIDGDYIGDIYGAPERALESLMDHMNQVGLEDRVREMVESADRIRNSGACSGCSGIGDDELWDYSEAARG